MRFVLPAFLLFLSTSCLGIGDKGRLIRGRLVRLPSLSRHLSAHNLGQAMPQALVEHTTLKQDS